MYDLRQRARIMYVRVDKTKNKRRSGMKRYRYANWITYDNYDRELLSYLNFFAFDKYVEVMSPDKTMAIELYTVYLVAYHCASNESVFCLQT